MTYSYMVKSSLEYPYLKMNFTRRNTFHIFIPFIKAYDNYQFYMPVMLDIEWKIAEVLLILPQIKYSIQQNYRYSSEKGKCL
jgi:hypothetical protein